MRSSVKACSLHEFKNLLNPTYTWLSTTSNTLPIIVVVASFATDAWHQIAFAFVVLVIGIDSKNFLRKVLKCLKLFGELTCIARQGLLIENGRGRIL